MTLPGCLTDLRTRPLNASAFLYLGRMSCGLVLPPNWWILAYLTFVPTPAVVASLNGVIDAASRPLRCRMRTLDAARRPCKMLMVPFLSMPRLPKAPPTRDAKLLGFRPSHLGRPSLAKF